jgi:hypothetical protein
MKTETEDYYRGYDAALEKCADYLKAFVEQGLSAKDVVDAIVTEMEAVDRG